MSRLVRSHSYIKPIKVRLVMTGPSAYARLALDSLAFINSVRYPTHFHVVYYPGTANNQLHRQCCSRDTQRAFSFAGSDTTASAPEPRQILRIGQGIRCVRFQSMEIYGIALHRQSEGAHTATGTLTTRLNIIVLRMMTTR